LQVAFRYEAAWIRAPDYRETLEKAWEAASDGTHSLQATCRSLYHVASSLKVWSKDCFGSVRLEINKLEKRLKTIRLQPRNQANNKVASEVEGRLCQLFEREEVMARQRSRVD
jgi:hypothetical protein